MASVIFLGSLKPYQKYVGSPSGFNTWYSKTDFDGLIAVIAKGNIIEGIEAKE